MNVDGVQRDVKELIKTCNDIKVSVARLEEAVNGMHGCNEEQDVKLSQHNIKIGLLETKTAVLETRQYILLFVGGTVGGVLGGLVQKFLGG